MTVDMTALAKAALIGELEVLHKEISTAAEPLDDKQFWTKPLEPGNSFGHLVLHLTGNLNHFVGAQLGHTGYVRDREREFTETTPPAKAEAMAGLDATVALFRRVVGSLTAEQLAASHPESRFGSVLNTLTHLVAHFALHRGQMSYIVRLVKAGGPARVV
jgi:uncharacterized damage-inducible protein DinB